MFDLKGRAALVTGSTRGLGKAMAAALAKAGAKVTLNGLDEKRGKAAAAEIPGSTFIKADVTDEKDVATEIGRLQIEVASAPPSVTNPTWSPWGPWSPRR